MQPLLQWQSSKYDLFPVCVCGLCTQHAKPMRGFSFSSVASPHLQYFPALSHKRHHFRKKVTDYKMGVDFLYKCVLNISHSKNNSARYCHKCTQVLR